MGIKFHCPECDELLNIKVKLAGRRGFCPKCQAKIQIPHEPTINPEPSVETPVMAEPVFEPSTASQSSPLGAPSVTQATEPAVVENVAVVAPTPATPTATDPFSEAPDAVWYVRPPDGGQFGPASADLMRQWFNDGRVGASSLIWREGWTDWLVAGQVFANMPVSAVPQPQVSANSSNPVQVTPVGSSPVAGNANINKINYYRTRKRKAAMAFTIITIGVVIILALIVLLFIILSNQ